MMTEATTDSWDWEVVVLQHDVIDYAVVGRSLESEEEKYIGTTFKVNQQVDPTKVNFNSPNEAVGKRQLSALQVGNDTQQVTGDMAEHFNMVDVNLDYKDIFKDFSAENIATSISNSLDEQSCAPQVHPNTIIIDQSDATTPSFKMISTGRKFEIPLDDEQQDHTSDMCLFSFLNYTNKKQSSCMLGTLSSCRS